MRPAPASSSARSGVGAGDSDCDMRSGDPGRVGSAGAAPAVPGVDGVDADGPAADPSLFRRVLALALRENASRTTAQSESTAYVRTARSLQAHTCRMCAEKRGHTTPRRDRLHCTDSTARTSPNLLPGARPGDTFDDPDLLRPLRLFSRRGPAPPLLLMEEEEDAWPDRRARSPFGDVEDDKSPVSDLVSPEVVRREAPVRTAEREESHDVLAGAAGEGAGCGAWDSPRVPFGAVLRDAAVDSAGPPRADSSKSGRRDTSEILQSAAMRWRMESSESWWLRKREEEGG